VQNAFSARGAHCYDVLLPPSLQKARGRQGSVPILILNGDTTRLPADTTLRISGHETFALRYAWIPKCVEAVLEEGGEALFSREDEAMVRLGVGKNMVRSIRFWAEAAGVISGDTPKHYTVSELGKTVFEPKAGLDPYLEDDQTLWLLHWKLSTGARPLLAWSFLLNRWHEPEMMSSSIALAVNRELEGTGSKVSENSLRSHLGVFFHTYCPAASNSKGASEESLDCPLVSLRLLERRCTRQSVLGRQEDVYAFRRGTKPEIGKGLFAFALQDYWQRTAPEDRTISLRELAFGHGSPGQVFKLGEHEIRQRLDQLDIPGFSYSDSSLIQSVHREEGVPLFDLRTALGRVYS